MYELTKKNGNVLTSKSVGTGPSSYEKRIYWAAVSQRLRNTVLQCSDFVLHKHSCSFTKSSTNGVWQSFHLKPTGGYFQTDQQKINQTANKRSTH